MKIFGLGLSKTGTTSLTAALCQLGYQVEHNGQMFLTESREELADLDGATDELGTSYRELDQKFPNSKYILTIRDSEAWLKSCSHHFRAPIDESTHAGRMMLELYGTTTFDTEKFLAGYNRHIENVKAYFRDRPNDLLVLNVSSDDVWQRLCAFVDRPVPDTPFPRENVSRSFSRFKRKVKRLWGGSGSK